MEKRSKNQRTNVKNKKQTKNNKNKVNTKNNQKKKMSIWKKTVLLLLLIIIVAGGVFAYKVHKNGGGVSGMLATVVGQNEETRKNMSEIKFLILGISTDQENVELTDTIMVASYNPKTQKATLLSIPRDTYTGNNTARATAYEKINALYSRKHRPDETLAAVNKITGLDIQYYVVVKTEALIKLVDVIGGVKFNVPIDMDYDDVTQDLHIHLKAGEQLLDGDKAEQVVRFRHNNDGTSFPASYGDNDIGRMRTQRDFIMEVVKQTAKPSNIFKIGQILEVAKENVITNIDFDTAKDYIPYIVEFDTSNLITESLPGTAPDWRKTNNVSIFVYDKQKTAQLVQQIFIDRDNPESTEQNTEGTSGESSNETAIKVEVLNGSSSTQALQKAVKQLEEAGYNVTSQGNTNTTSKTVIINKQNIDENELIKVKETIGVGSISNSQSSSSKVDLSVVLGKDYE